MQINNGKVEDSSPFGFLIGNLAKDSAVINRGNDRGKEL